MHIKIFKLSTSKQLFFCLLTLLYFTMNPASYAGQTIETITTDENTPIIKDAFEWQFMLDLALVKSQHILADIEQTKPSNYLALGLLLDISYKGFFLQTNSRRSSTIIDGGEFGYQITVQNNWQLDLIFKAYIDGFDAAEIIEEQDKYIPRLEGLNARNLTGGIALRYSRFFDDAVFYIDFASARAFENNQGDYATGLIIDSFYSYLVPYRNWDIYFGAGLTYYDQSLIDYYIGIDTSEVTSIRPLHRADSAFRGQLEIYAQHPLSENWSFNVGVTQSFYSSNIKKSPLVDSNKLTEFMLGVLYVF